MPYYISRIQLSSFIRLPESPVRVLVAAAMLFTLLASGAVGFAATRTAESRSPVESEEEFAEKLAEGVVNRQRCFRLMSGDCKLPAVSLKKVHVHRFYRSSLPGHVKGHRLANGLLAPLTC